MFEKKLPIFDSSFKQLCTSSLYILYILVVCLVEFKKATSCLL
ncbi:unnamed protein product [Ixodes pacificus]